MLLTCPHCEARYRVRLERIPARGVKATCTGCRIPFIALPDPDGRAAPPRPVAWVFAGDPAIAELVDGPCHKLLRKRFELRVMAAEDRANGIKALEEGTVNAPDTLIFGDMLDDLDEAAADPVAIVNKIINAFASPWTVAGARAALDHLSEAARRQGHPMGHIAANVSRFYDLADVVGDDAL